MQCKFYYILYLSIQTFFSNLNIYKIANLNSLKLMKNISYLDMIKELLPESDFLQFQKCYDNSIKKSVKIISHRWFNNNKDIREKVLSTLSDEWDLTSPRFSYKWNKYNDVSFATRKENFSNASLWSHYLHQAGLIYVQEMAASLSVQILWINPSDKVLDMCAAPWWKSIQIADKLTDWFLVSNEIDSWRKKALESNLHRCWIYNVWVIQQDWCVIWDKLPEIFDKVLVDAPCSWEWMQYKSDKKVWQRNEKKSRELSQLQIKLLISWLKSLKVWGELVYSTCTTNVLENECVISEVLKKCGDSLELLEVPLDEMSLGVSQWKWEEIISVDDAKKVARLWPHIHGTWWFFIAKFKKINHIWSECDSKCTSIDDWWGSFAREKIDYQNKLCIEAINKLNDWWITFNENILWLSVWKYTINVTVKELIDKHIENIFDNIDIWLPLFKLVDDNKLKEKKLIPLIWISQVFWNVACRNVLDIDEDQLKLLMEKRDLVDERLRSFENEYVILKWNWVWVWLISVKWWVWKNKCF